MSVPLSELERCLPRCAWGWCFGRQILWHELDTWVFLLLRDANFPKSLVRLGELQVFEGQALGLSQSESKISWKKLLSPSSLFQKQHTARGGLGHWCFMSLKGAPQAELPLWTWFSSFPGGKWWILLCWLLLIHSELGSPLFYSSCLRAGHSSNAS